MANIVPLNDKILIQRAKPEEKSKGGIILPESAKEKPREGKVIALGAGKVTDDGTRAEFQVKKNDRIIFSSYAGTEVKVGAEEYLILGEDDVLAVID